MGFDVKKFSKAKFVDRTEAVRIPEESLSAFFSEGDPREFVIRGLTGEEMARVNEATARQKNLGAVIEAVSSAIQADKVKGLKDLIGLGDDMPEDLARRIEMLSVGCVDPKLDVQTAGKIFRVAHVTGFDLTNRMLFLSRQGMILGESNASGKTTGSRQLST